MGHCVHIGKVSVQYNSFTDPDQVFQNELGSGSRIRIQGYFLLKFMRKITYVFFFIFVKFLIIMISKLNFFIFLSWKIERKNLSNFVSDIFNKIKSYTWIWFRSHIKNPYPAPR